MLNTICPNFMDHTSGQPITYLAWHEWAKEKSKTHKQVRCSTCGLYAIWIEKTQAQEGGE